MGKQRNSVRKVKSGFFIWIKIASKVKLQSKVLVTQGRVLVRKLIHQSSSTFWLGGQDIEGF
jgi:hypothetical protein